MYILKDGSLMHYGIQGQKWGIRRYQYEDGTLTPEGRKRYGRLLDDPSRYTSGSGLNSKSGQKRALAKVMKRDLAAEEHGRKLVGDKEWEELRGKQKQLDALDSKMYGLGNQQRKLDNDYYVRNVISKDLWSKKMSELDNQRTVTQQEMNNIVDSTNKYLKRKYGGRIYLQPTTISMRGNLKDYSYRSDKYAGF